MAAAVPVIVGGVIVGGVWFQCQQREKGGGCLLSRWGARASAWFLSSLAVPDIAATMAGRWRALDSQTGSRGHRAAPPPVYDHGRNGHPDAYFSVAVWRWTRLRHSGFGFSFRNGTI